MENTLSQVQGWFKQQGNINLSHVAHGDLKRRFSFLDELARQNQMVIYLFNRAKFEYVFESDTIYEFYGIPVDQKTSFRTLLPSLVENRNDFLHSLKMLNQMITLGDQTSSYLNATCYICGTTIKHLQNKKRMRLFIQSAPLDIHMGGHEVLSLNIVRDVSYLLEQGGCWIRSVNNSRISSGFTLSDRMFVKDIVTPSELQIIRLWGDGNCFSEIAAIQGCAINTIKNHLMAARRKLLARDNTALYKLCLLAGVFR